MKRYAHVSLTYSLAFELLYVESR